MSKVYTDIQAERQRQDEKWGKDRSRHPLEWLTILGEEVGEVNRAVVEAHFSEYGKSCWWRYREELVQVAAVAVAMIECHDRNIWEADT